MQNNYCSYSIKINRHQLFLMIHETFPSKVGVILIRENFSPIIWAPYTINKSLYNTISTPAFTHIYTYMYIHNTVNVTKFHNA